MIEAEIKLRAKKPDTLPDQLEQLGFSKAGILREEDIYFDNDAHQIRGGGMAMRVRTETDLTENKSTSVITFKGQKLDKTTMTRQELETGVEDPRIAIQIFEALGYRGVDPKVVKTRYNYTRANVTASIDVVEGLGHFLELEILIEDEKNRPEAMKQLQNLLDSLGYEAEESLTNSYLSMLQGVND